MICVVIDLAIETKRLRLLGDCQGISRFLIPGFDVLPMTYLNPRSAPLNDDISRFTSVVLDGISAIKIYCRLVSMQNNSSKNWI